MHLTQILFGRKESCNTVVKLANQSSWSSSIATFTRKKPHADTCALAHTHIHFQTDLLLRANFCSETLILCEKVRWRYERAHANVGMKITFWVTRGRKPRGPLARSQMEPR